jgi:hypothetical protein
MIDRAPDRLDLTWLSAGTRQRAFVPTGQSPPRWVYKVPAETVDHTPYGFALAGYRPDSPPARVVYRLAFAVPEAARYAADTRSSRLLSRALDAGCELRNGVLNAWFARNRRAHFDEMLEILARMLQRGLGDIMLPVRIIPAAQALLRLDDGLSEYHGPMLQQQYAAQFLVHNEGFDRLDPRDVIEAQHRLWRHGFALTDSVAILGPRQWALCGRRLRLADTSSLTTSRYRAWRALDPAALEARITGALSRQTGGQVPAAVEYFDRVRREINRDTLRRLWRS